MGTDKQKEIFAVEYAGWWDIQDSPDYNGKNLLDADNVGYEQAQANAELIVKAVNNYEAMKEVLENASNHIKWCIENLHKPHTSDHFNIPANAIQEIEDLLQQLNK